MRLQPDSIAGDYRPSPILLGALLGALVGVGEVLAGMLAPASAITRRYLLEAAILYAAGGALVGVGLTVIGWAVARRRPTFAVSVATLLGFFVFLIVAGYVNVRYLPQAFDRASMLFTALILVGAVGVGLIFHRGLSALPVARWAEARRPRRALGALLAAIGLAVVLASILPGGGGAVPVENPGAGRDRNVVFIVIDALRYDHMSQNGYARETTPQLDAWAREAVVFDDAQAQAPWTKPSTATLLTSLYPSTHGVNSMTSAVPHAVDLLPAMLRRNGFRTAIFTANHFITPEFGFDRGTQHFFSSHPPRLQQLLLGHLLQRLGSRVRPVGDLVLGLTRAERVFGGAAPEGGLGAEGLTRALGDWLNDIGDERFFAYLHFMEPHAPYDPPEPYATFFMPEGPARHLRVINFPAYGGFLPFEPARPMSADSLANMVARYDGGIRAVDARIGELISELKRRGRYANTLLVVTADHGEEFYDHGGWGHGQSLHDELLHVPLILSGPELDAARGRRLPHAVRHVDVVPTILDICGLPAPEGLAGRSLLPIVRGVEPPEPGRPVYSEVDFGGRFARSLREGTRKVIRAQSGGSVREMVFDVAADPRELRDLRHTETAGPDVALARLEAFHANVSRNAIAEETVTIDEATHERLRALGYIR